MRARWWHRRRARRRLGKDVRLFYHRDYAAPGLALTSRIAGVDPERGERVIGALHHEGLVPSGRVEAPRPVSIASLRAVHSDAWLEAASRPETLGHVFGLETDLVEVDPLLNAARRAVGGTVAAAVAAALEGTRVALNLGGGFHHAEPEQGSGFCVYNDVAVAISHLRRLGFEAPIAIVDLDYHQGNGNKVAFAEDPTVLTFSLHGSVWSHVKAVADVEVCLPPGTGDAEYLAALGRALPGALDAHDPGLIFYLAGNDVLGGDRLGDYELTFAGVLARDRLVVEQARRRDVPLVITLAGGYRDDAWRATASLLRWLLTDVAVTSSPDSDGIERYFRIAPTLDTFELQRGAEDDLGFTAEDLVHDLTGRSPARRFLGYYTLQGIEYALERYGLFEKLRERGFKDPRVSWDLSDSWRQVVRIHGARRGDPEERYHLLVETVARKEQHPVPEGVTPPDPMEVLWLEWLLLQDPSSTFSLARPRLPGQDHPGLGLARDIVAVLAQICHRLDLEALLHRPAHYHVAYVSAGDLWFLDPVAQGRFEAMRTVLADEPLTEATALVDREALRLGSGEVVAWDPGTLCLPVSRRLEAYLASAEYRRRAREAHEALLAAGLHLAVDARREPAPSP